MVCFRIIHLACTLIFHFTIMRDLEKMAGWLRMSVIYILSGIGGYLYSAILLPYQAEVIQYFVPCEVDPHLPIEKVYHESNNIAPRALLLPLFLSLQALSFHFFARATRRSFDVNKCHFSSYRLVRLVPSLE